MNIKTCRHATLGLLVSAALGPCLAAGAHYVPGVEGTDSAAVPPKGDYYIGYLVQYTAHTLKAPGTSNSLPGTTQVKVNALANRLVRITDLQLLGADYGVELIVPIMDVSVNLTGVAGGRHSNSGIGDVYVGPLVLGWHGANWHGVAAAGLWLDNGHHDRTNLASVGKGYKSTMLTGGITYQLDDAKTWSASLLSRYETHGRQKDTGLKFGDTLTSEWGVGKALGAQKVGLVGYVQQQLGADNGTTALNQKAGKSAIGLDVSTPVPALGGMMKAAIYRESGAKAASAPEGQGRVLRLTFVKPL